MLLDSQLEIEAAGTLFSVVSGLIHKAGHSHYGSTVVIDMNDEPLVLSAMCWTPLYLFWILIIMTWPRHSCALTVQFK